MIERSKEVSVLEYVFEENVFICKSKESKNTWKVVKHNDKFYCNCPAFSRDRKHCKHILAVLNYKKIDINKY
jgi:hypothetical protein